jgi:hypothetical protein
MTAWTEAESLAQLALEDPGYTLTILKAIPLGAYKMPEPTHPDGQVGPDGATFDAIARLASMQEPDVTRWVSAHQRGNLIMACFAYGLEYGQVDPDCYAARVTIAEKAIIRSAAARELADWLGPRGWRTDHLAGA